jgi:ubiquinone/menaquinone biosynthesis C-methylase UbiE
VVFVNLYNEAERAAAYARLGFANTYYLAYRDLPKILAENVAGKTALDFGCGTGRSTRFLRELGFDVVGFDISAHMVEQARTLDLTGDYRLADARGLKAFNSGTFDLVLCAFPFDNIAGYETKIALLRDLSRLLTPAGKIVNVVSSPEIYWHEWASFTTRAFPENRSAKSGDIVRIITTDLPGVAAVEDILWTEESYSEVYARAGLRVVEKRKPLADGTEPFRWVNETKIAPWTIYVLAAEYPNLLGA